MAKSTHDETTPQILSKKMYEKEVVRLQEELVAMQEWIRTTGTRLGRPVRGT
jgi:polyphosphate kinase 2 (PPK2 family)